jgi:hypothetical protein
MKQVYTEKERRSLIEYYEETCLSIRGYCQSRIISTYFEGKGFTCINLKMEKVNDFEVYLPKNLSEQSDIVVYLVHKTQTINRVVGIIQNQITI